MRQDSCLVFCVACAAPLALACSHGYAPARGLAAPVRLQNQAPRRSAIARARLCRRRLAEDLGPQHGAGRAGLQPARCPTLTMATICARCPARAIRIGHNFSNLPMPADSPYRCGWWYRKEFTAPAAAARDGRFWLHFGGINYRGEIWLNGKKIADSTHGRRRLSHLRLRCDGCC